MALGQYRLISMLLYNIAKKQRFDKDTDLCLYVAKLQVPRVPEVLWLQILNSACPLQSYKLPEFQKFYGRRHLTLPVLCKVTNYQSSRSFMASNCDLYMSNSKFPSFESFKFPKLQIHPHILPLLPRDGYHLRFWEPAKTYFPLHCFNFTELHSFRAVSFQTRFHLVIKRD